VQDALTSNRYQLVLAMKCKDSAAAASALTCLGHVYTVRSEPGHVIFPVTNMNEIFMLWTYLKNESVSNSQYNCFLNFSISLAIINAALLISFKNVHVFGSPNYKGM
jgi:hypothetical protein